ncbi:helix-turn-helix domain-containing protein [uncultured Algibacter sp.]|uniref:helix-turn-helix domain-containing protein n=1 Tax=uncultured Algibacter sp. TaxID=298659 RepID=UPI00261DFE15|nr:helix-turn-helix domain-containing protein [uncultured Algibacter sp.]
MNFEKQFIFFFSALGAFNGFLLAFYFAYIANKKKFSNYFLAFLLLSLSIRIAKSVFFHFNPKLSGIFIQIGLSACTLIGPFLYLYLKSYIKKETSNWKLHVFPILVGIIVLGITYPYIEHKTIWSTYIVKTIYLQWLVYIVLSFKFVKALFKRLLNKTENLSSIDIWLISIFSGTTIICVSYIIGSYTSSIVGALSFSFILYLIILLFIFRNKKSISFFEEKEKYENKKINNETVKQISKRINVVKNKKLYLNPNLTINNVAKELNVSQHTLSQILNNNFDKSFSLFINELRVEKAKELLTLQNQYTIEAIGYESGFNSKSTFFTTFKKITGYTPSEYQKSQKK